MNTSVDQSNASADGDIVGGNKNAIYLPLPNAPGVVEQLISKLQFELEKNVQVRHTIETLARFHVKRSPDGIVGLEEKLKAGDRESEIMDALEKKEIFAKFLDRWALYASAQEIIAFLLARAEYEFNFFIAPQISTLSKVEINMLVHEKVVVPTISECGAAVFVIDHSTAMGMIYWLAEQCYVKWHQ